MKNRIKITMTALALFALTVSGTAQPGKGYGQRSGDGPGRDGQPAVEKILDDLTEEQKEALKALRFEHQKEMTSLRNQMGELRAKQKTLMSENPLDEKAAKANSAAIADHMQKQMEAQIEHKAKLQEILTEEQMLKMEQLQKRRKMAHRKMAARGAGQHNRAGHPQGQRR